ncbi:hypothetical protein ST12_08370 [Clostridium botulinum]|uniref:hypothetical protein n=1 Tax=Clostridium botulinum TaxID=1491 RepID=UPI000174E451|nr:hypothetical protein [Clostridium botulinum]ACD52450.1 gp2 [Clostridium botulinum E3 str. Alaska E43]AJF29700.1 hypothetical protein ST13_08370 [Clostridium botulinum]AJF32761.1 hypothetical protein ST12_08370 [Clostridium botulinum]MBY6949092.1 hypothetical protein [Clostridium botulinum]MBY7022788.1 hypothetical protein [Clostridium botulinum]
MKVGLRKPSIKKSIKARTTGKLKREIKRSINPLYGKKGMGYINDPKKAIYNKVYNKTTFEVKDIIDVSSVKKENIDNYNKENTNIGVLGIIVELLNFIANLFKLAFYIGILVLIGYIILGIIF